MFSEITRMRPAWARRPEVAMLIERAKSLMSLLLMICWPYPCASALADRGLQQMQALAVERGDRRIVHLVGAYLHHLLFETDGIAGRPRLEAHLAVLVKTVRAAAGRNDMRGAGAHHRERAHRSRGRAGVVEFRFDQVARLEIRCVRVGDIFGKDALALLVPLHLGAQHGQDRKIADGHRRRSASWRARRAPSTRQNLPCAWLTAG